MADKPTSPDLPDHGDKPGNPETPDHGDKPDDGKYRFKIDATSHEWPRAEISFDEVVDLAYPNGGRGPLITYTVNYKDAVGPKDEGKLVEGQSVRLKKEGTSFNVTRTDRS